MTVGSWTTDARLATERLRDLLELTDDLGARQLAPGTLQRLADPVETRDGDDPAERPVLARALAGGDVHAVRVRAPPAQRVGQVGAGGAGHGGVDGAVVDPAGDEALVVAVGQLPRQVGVVAVRDRRHVDVQELPRAGEVTGPAGLLEPALEVLADHAERLAAGTADADEEEGTKHVWHLLRVEFSG